MLAGIATVAILFGVSPADAGKRGFLSALLRVGAHAARVGAHSYTAPVAKTYGAEVMTVAQIESCINTATELERIAEIVDALNAQNNAAGQEGLTWKPYR